MMDRFTEQKGVTEDEWNLVFVDTIEDYYDEAAEAPVEEEGSPNSPFTGKTPQECYQLLKLIEDTESEIVPYYFAIMDERSTQDDTVLLVCAEQNLEGEVVSFPTVRATFKASALALILYDVGKSSVGEGRERAQREPDNIFRGRYGS